MKENKKITQVHRLPTEDRASKIWFDFEANPFLNDISKLLYDPVGVMNCKPQHLYFTTDEEIKAGDKILELNDNQILTCLGINEDGRILVYEYKNVSASKDVVRKITASTDPKLEVSLGKPYIADMGVTITPRKALPQIPQDFIKAYCEQGGFDEVDVEYETYNHKQLFIGGYAEPGSYTYDLRPKLNPDNTVITHLIEEKMYSLDEVIKISEYVRVGHTSTPDVRTKALIDEYLQIKENL